MEVFMQANNLLPKTRRITVLALLSAISIVLVALIHFPIFHAVWFLEYDPADIPIIICGLFFGPFAGLMVTVVASVVQGLTVSAQSGFYGIIMHIIATGTYVTVSSLIYRRKKTMLLAIIGIAAGTIAMALAMAYANLLITPYFMNATVDDVKTLLFPFIIPFNLIKAGANGIIALMLYKPVEIMLKKLGF